MPETQTADTWTEVAITTSYEGNTVERRFATNATNPQKALFAAFNNWAQSHNTSLSEAVRDVDDLTLGSYHIVRLPYREPDLRFDI